MSKTAQCLFYILITLLAAGALVGVYYLARRPIPPPVITETVNSTTSTLPVVTKIIRENLPARIDTVFIDNTMYEMAYHTERIERERAIVDLDIEYDERFNLFDIRADVTSFNDSIYVEKIIEKTEYIPRPPIAFTADMGVGFSGLADVDPEYVSLGAGIKIVDKFRVGVFADTRLTYGLRLGVDF
jgi:hypothetical protein